MAIDTLLQPINQIVAVTPSDIVDLTGGMARALFVGVAGAVSIQSAAGTTDIIPSLAAGIRHEIRCTRINATGTTATGIAVGY